MLMLSFRNSHNKKYATDFKPGKHQKNWSVKRYISVPSMALYSAGNGVILRFQGAFSM